MSETRLNQARGPECFWVNNGPIVKDLAELRQALFDMDAGTFAYHTRRDGNNFAVWVDAVLGEADLAQRLAKLKTKNAQIRAIEKRLAEAGVL